MNKNCRYKTLISFKDSEISFADLQEAIDYFLSIYPNYYDDLTQAVDLEDLAYMLNQLSDEYMVIEI